MGHFQCLKFLLELGRTGVNVRYPGGSTPLHVHAREGRIEPVRFLLDSGADIKVRTDTCEMGLIMLSEDLV